MGWWDDVTRGHFIIARLDRAGRDWTTSAVSFAPKSHIERGEMNKEDIKMHHRMKTLM